MAFQGGPGNLLCESAAPLLPLGQVAEVAQQLADQGFAITPHFLSVEEVHALAEEARHRWTLGAFREAGVGRGNQTRLRAEIRTDRICWLHPETATPAQRVYFQKLEALREAVNARTFAGLFDWEGHLAVYPHGAFYRPHLDRFAESSSRLVTTVLYLNETWEPGDGGELRIWLTATRDELQAPTGAYLDVPPIGGTLVSFWSDQYVHEVLPAQFERMSVTGWFRQRAL